MLWFAYCNFHSIVSYLKWIKVLFVYKLILKYSEAGYQSDIKKYSIITDVNSKPRCLNRMCNIKIFIFDSHT